MKMTVEEIKKLRMDCRTNGNCADCRYGGEECDCLYLFQDDALRIIERQEQEIERLRNEKWDAQDDLDCYHSEMKNEIKQAKIEVLEMVRQQLADNGALTVKSAITIDELIEEVKAE